MLKIALAALALSATAAVAQQGVMAPIEYKRWLAACGKAAGNRADNYLRIGKEEWNPYRADCARPKKGPPLQIERRYN